MGTICTHGRMNPKNVPHELDKALIWPPKISPTQTLNIQSTFFGNHMKLTSTFYSFIKIYLQQQKHIHKKNHIGLLMQSKEKKSTVTEHSNSVAEEGLPYLEITKRDKFQLAFFFFFFSNSEHQRGKKEEDKQDPPDATGILKQVLAC